MPATRRARLRLCVASALAAISLAIAALAPALACGICLAPPERTAVDHIVAARDVVLAREDPARPFRFAAVEVLRGTADGAPIPVLLDAGTRRRLAAEPELSVLFTRGSGSAGWQRLLSVNGTVRPLLDAVLARGRDWLRPSGAQERFRFFAALHDHPEPDVAALALAELDRTPWRLLRTLEPRLSRAALRARLDSISGIAWVPVRLRLLALGADAADRRLLRERLEAVAAVGSAGNLEPLALALVEADGATAIERLVSLYGPGEARTHAERAAVAAALATHGTDGDGSLRAPVLAALHALLDADPRLAPAVAHTMSAMKDWSGADGMSGVLFRGAFPSPQDRFIVAAYVAEARAHRRTTATSGSEKTMTNTLRNATLVAAAFTALASPALAHEATGVAGGLASGFLHPLLGWDHVAAMVAVGLLGAVLGPPAILLLPVVFPLVMAAGGALGVAGVPLPAVEIGIAASAVVLGLMVAMGRAVPVWTAAIVVAFFAVFHGHAHGTELPAAADAVAYGIGFVVGTGLLHLVGIVLGLAWRWDAGRVAVRSAGGMIAVAGVAFLTGVA